MQVHGHRHGHYALSQLQNFRQAQEQRFATADADGDGSLTQAEFEALGKTLPTGKGDTPAKASASDIIAKFDADDSGNLDVDEIGQLLASRRGCSWACLLKAQEAAEEAAVSETAEPEESSGGVAQPALANLFDKLDADGDGALSLDEFRALRPYHRHHGLLARLWLQEREVTPPEAAPSETTEAAETTEAVADNSTTPVEETTA